MIQEDWTVDCRGSVAQGCEEIAQGDSIRTDRIDSHRCLVCIQVHVYGVSAFAMIHISYLFPVSGVHRDRWTTDNRPEVSVSIPCPCSLMQRNANAIIFASDALDIKL